MLFMSLVSDHYSSKVFREPTLPTSFWPNDWSAVWRGWSKHGLKFSLKFSFSLLTQQQIKHWTFRRKIVWKCVPLPIHKQYHVFSQLFIHGQTKHHTNLFFSGITQPYSLNVCDVFCSVLFIYHLVFQDDVNKYHLTYLCSQKKILLESMWLINSKTEDDSECFEGKIVHKLNKYLKSNSTW